MRLIMLALVMLTLTGCETFRVCPDVPKPPPMSDMPDRCYLQLRPGVDAPAVVLDCYVNYIINLERAAEERERALGAYR